MAQDCIIVMVDETGYWAENRSGFEQLSRNGQPVRGRDPVGPLPT